MNTIRYNRTTNHIDGIAIRTQGGEFVYSKNACGTITRSRLAEGKTYETLAEALEAARKGGRKLCKTCEAAALAQLAEAPKGETFRFLVVRAAGRTETVEIQAANAAEAKAEARKLAGVQAVSRMA